LVSNDSKNVDIAGLWRPDNYRDFEEVGEQNIRAKWDSYYLSIT